MKKFLLFASAVAVLFSSCSTDKTEDIVGTEVNGAITATAAYQQDATRTYFKNGNVTWSKGDALGVIGEAGTQVQFGLVSGADTQSGKFAGNTNFLEVNKQVFAYYPYDRNAEYDVTNNSVTLEIPNEQTYLPSDNENGSFDATMAPGVAYIEKVESLTEIPLNFKGVASYLYFPIRGIGTVKSLELSVETNSAPVILSGYGNVAFYDDEATKNVDELALVPVSDTSDKIVLECGALELQPYETTTVMFVVPAGIDLQSKFTLVATMADGSTSTVTREAKAYAAGVKPNLSKRNQQHGIAAVAGTGNPWMFGTEGKFLINNDANATSAFGDKLTAEERFLAYAYLTRPGAAKVPAGVTTPEQIMAHFADYIYAAGMLNIDDAMDVASIQAYIYTSVLDFAAYSKDWAQTQYDATAVVLANDADNADAKFWQNVYKWYKNNEGAIESLSYNGVNGAVAPYATIKNLKVVGTGISNGASLKNVAFEAVEVATDATVAAAGLIAPYSQMTAQPYGAAAPAEMVIENVIISADNSINAPKAEYVGGIYGSFKKNVNMIGSARAINIVAPGTKNTGRLFGASLVGTFLDFTANNYEWHTGVNNYYAIGYLKTNATVVAEGTVDATKKNAGVAEKVSNTGTEIASIIVDGVSYWNGGAEADNTSNDYYTAENLAYDIAMGAMDTNIVLGNNIDMQCSINFTAVAPIADAVAGIEAPAEQYVNFDNYTNNTSFNVTSAGDKTKFEIKNLIAVSNKYIAALFGKEADLSNVTISNVTIYAAKSSSLSGEIKTLAGIAESGSAKNVTINGLTINIAADAVLNCKSIGGVFATATPEAIEDVTVSALAINGPVENLPIRAGIIAGTLEVAPTTVPVVLKSIKLTGEASDYAVSNFGEKYNASNNINAFKDEKNYAGAYPFGTLYVNNASFPANSKGKAYVGVDNNFVTYGQGVRLAAGVVFADDLTSNQKDGVKVKIGKPTDNTEYDYALELTGGVQVGNKATTCFFGFTK